MPGRLAVARLWFEGNAFSPLPTGRAAFEAREWSHGAAALAAARGTATELAAVAEFADARPDWSVEVLRCASAMPGGPIDDALFEAYLQELARDLGAAAWDAVYLSLHGAAITRAPGSPEARLLQCVRGAVGEIPIGASFDLHGNLSPRIAELLDFASGYRTYPHVDMRETAARVLAQLERIVASGARPAGHIEHTGLLLGSFNMATAAEPMRSLEAEARSLERGAILDVSLFGGFPYADSPHCGAAVMAWADSDRRAAVEAAARLASSIRARAPAFEVHLPGPQDGLRQALAAPPGLVCVLDPADNPYSGGAADTPELLRALLASAPAVPAVFAYFCDPETVAAAWHAGAGARIRASLGGKRSALFGAPLELEFEVRRLTDGNYVNCGPMERGMHVRLGRTAVLARADIEIVVTERVAAADDPAFYALHGIELERTRLLCVKAKNHFRAAFADRCRAIIQVDCPGPAAADLRRLPFRNLRL